MQENIEKEKSPMVLKEQLQKLDELETSENLPKNVSMQLYKLMKQVVSDDVTPSTVRAACQCATEIHRMLKLNMEIK